MVETGLINNALSGGDVMSGVGHLGAKVGDLTTIIIYMALVGAVVFLVWRQLQYKHTVTVRDLTSSNNSRVRIMKARSLTQDGIEYWKLKKRKELLTSPPSAARDIDNRGKIYAECYHTETGGYHWIKDNKDPEKLEAAFNVFPTEHKTLWMARMRRAEERRKKSGWDVLLQVAPMAISVIMIVAFLAFYGDIMETNEAMMDKAWGYHTTLTQQNADTVESINKAVGVITGKLNSSELKGLAQTIPLNDRVMGATP